MQDLVINKDDVETIFVLIEDLFNESRGEGHTAWTDRDYLLADAMDILENVLTQDG